MSDTLFCYSLNEETYTGRFASRDAARDAGVDDAIANAFDLGEPPDRIWTARCVLPTTEELLAGMVDAETMVERLEEHWTGELWHEAELAPAKEQLERLDVRLRETVEKWLRDHDLWPGWYTVTDVEEHDVDLIAAPVVGEDEA